MVPAGAHKSVTCRHIYSCIIVKQHEAAWSELKERVGLEEHLFLVWYPSHCLCASHVPMEVLGQFLASQHAPFWFVT